MNLLFLHQNLPGQYQHLLAHFAAEGRHSLVGIGEATHLPGPMDGVRVLSYPPPEGGSATTHPYVRDAEAAVRRGQVVARLLLDLKTQGWIPDVVCVHPGWGEGLFI